MLVRRARRGIIKRVNKSLETKLKTLPRKPGVYFHKSENGEIIYVGKAAVLRNRVRQYFQDSRLRDAKTTALVNEIFDTDWVETESEIDALFLESEMVKRYMPRYNVLLRDDKSQSFVRIDMKSEWPHVSFTRNPSDDGAEYFGPFYNASALKKAVRYLRPIYPYFVREPNDKMSKLEMQIGLNPDMREGSESYKRSLRKLISYIKGNRKKLANELEMQMKTAAGLHDFEKAAEYRNKLRYMQELQQRVMFGDREFLDISKDQALVDLMMILGLKNPPKRIEGFDISHHGGQNVVASMVVFTNGASDRAQYRKFKMTNQKNDDTGQMFETLCRRLSEKNRKSWGEPDLMLIDGGKGQLAAAIRAQNERGTEIPMIAIAKREEEIIIAKHGSNVDMAALQTLADQHESGVGVYDEGDYVMLNLHVGQRNASGHSRNLRGSGDVGPARYRDITKLFQRIRDESHRFAISYHSTLARKQATTSTLETLPGIGPKTRAKLIKKFGSMRGVKVATEADIAAVIGSKNARVIMTHFVQKS